MKIIRRVRIKIRVREPVQESNPETFGNCPLCGSEVQPGRLPPGTSQTAETGLINESAEQISKETENNKKL